MCVPETTLATATIQGLPESALKTEAVKELHLSRKGKLHLQRAPQKKEVLMRESKVVSLLCYLHNSVLGGSMLLSCSFCSNKQRKLQRGSSLQGSTPQEASC